jgi:hypothetical protein
MLMWSFSWHYEGMKEDALQKGLPAPDGAAVRELVLAKNVEAPDLATVKDFLRFHAAAGKSTIVEQMTCDSLNTFAEWFFAGFVRVTDTPINGKDHKQLCCRKWRPQLPGPNGRPFVLRVVFCSS